MHLSVSRGSLSSIAFFLLAASVIYVFYPIYSIADDLTESALEMERGARAYLAENWELAFKHFNQAVQKDPGNIKALHLTGICAARLGWYDRAESFFTRATHQPDAPADVWYDLGVVFYQQHKFRQAAAALETARAKGSSQPAIPYYLGAALARMGKYRTALSELEKAERTLPTLKANVLYYEGLCLLGIGENERASQKLAEAAKLDKNTPLGERARFLLKGAGENMRFSKWWEASLEVGGGYDSNVAYLTEDTKASGKAAPTIYGEAEIEFFPLRIPVGWLGIGYDGYISHYFPANSRSDVFNYDLFQHTAIEESNWLIAKNLPRVYLGERYEFGYVFLGGEHYEDSHQVEIPLTISESSLTSTKISCVGARRNFLIEPGRDSWYLKPYLTQFFYFLSGKGQAGIEAAYHQNDAVSNMFDFRGAEGGGMVHVPIGGPLYTEVAASYLYLNYVNHPDARKDKRISGEIELGATFLNHLTILANVQYFHNDSLKEYRYDKFVTLGAVRAKF